jgi:hypothetical protein
MECGGVISRIVRDKDDQIESLFFPGEDIIVGIANNAVAMQYFWEAAQGSDSEPDLYMFNFAGYSGQFIFDNNNTDILIIPHQALKIEPFCEGSKCGFLITTPDGVKYYFLDSEFTKSRVLDIGQTEPETIESAWYLSEIIHPFGDQIIFTYTGDYYNYISGRSESVDIRPVWGGCNNSTAPTNSFDVKRSRHSCLITGKKLVSVSSNSIENGVLSFSHNQSAPDIMGYDLISNMSMLDKNGKIIENFDLSYQSTSTKRIFLQKVQFLDPTMNYLFDYINPTVLPERLSYSQDHWGYFNNKSNSTLVPKPNDDFEYRNFTVAADRSPDSNYSKSGLLQKITYPTKGFSIIEYEANTSHGNKTIPGHVGHLYLNTTTFDGSTLIDYETSTAVETQYIEMWVGVDYATFTDPDYCTNDTTRHASATVSIFDNTESVNVPLQILLNSGLALRDGSSFNPYTTSINSHCFVYLIKDHNYTITLHSDGHDCSEASVNIDYIDQPSYTIVTEIETGGLRVKRTVSNTGETTQNETSRYYYGQINNLDISSGDMGVIPQYLSITQTMESCPYPLGSVGSNIHHIISSSSINSLFNPGNSNIYYKYVTVSNGGDNFENGGTEHEFTIHRDEPGNNIYGENIASAPWTNFGWDNGNEKSVTDYRKNDLGTLKRIKYSQNNYISDNRINKEAFGYTIRKKYNIPLSAPILCNCSQADTDYDVSYWVCTTSHNHVLWLPSGKCIKEGNNNVEMHRYHPYCHNQLAGYQYLWDDMISNLDIMSYKTISWWKYLAETTTTLFDIDEQPVQTTTTTYTYENENHIQLTKVETKDSKEQVIQEKTYYPDDVLTTTSLLGTSLLNEEFLAIEKLKKDDQYRIGLPIQKESYINGNKINTTRYLYKGYGDLILQSKAQFALGNNPLEDRIVYNAYDESNGNLLQAQKKDDIPLSFIYGYDSTYLIAETQNATISECGYTGFENNESNSLPIPGYATTAYVTDAYTGHKALQVSSLYGPGTSFTVGDNAQIHSGYKASVWVKGAPEAYLHIQVDGQWGTNARATNSETGTGWHHLEVELPRIKIQPYFSSNLKVGVYVGTNGGAAIFDDLRFYPMDAQMTTYTYDPLIGVTSVSDVNNKPTIYKYDAFNRLWYIKDFQGNILKKYDYHYKQP